jgi:mono/diheme cytochrome c family protein
MTRTENGYGVGRWATKGALVAVVAAGLLGHGMAGAQPQVPRGWRFTLPAGDAAAGERAFAKMQCYSCHTVPGKQFVDPAQKPGGIGPDLVAAYARLPREYLAESILDSRRVIAHGNVRFQAPDGSSRMGDYSENMTVRELVDIVEFLKQRQ